MSEITMSDVRLMAGEGKLSAHDVLAACNAVLRMRRPATPPMPGFQPGMSEPIRGQNTDLDALLQSHREIMVAALKKIAALDDREADAKLRQHGTFRWFDEPVSVEVARYALSRVGELPTIEERVDEIQARYPTVLKTLGDR